MMEIDRKKRRLRPLLKTYLVKGIINGNVTEEVNTFVNENFDKPTTYKFDFHGGILDIEIVSTADDKYEKIVFSFIILE